MEIQLSEDGQKTTLLLIRHGHTVGGDELRYKGHIDVQLSDRGGEQLRALAERLNDKVESVYTSDLQRARRSAEIVAGRFGVEPVAVRELRERSFGKWEGMSFNEVSDEYPDEFDRWKADPLKFSPPEGESTLDVNDRAVKVLTGLLQKHRGERFAIVSHGGINRVMLCYFMGLPLNNIFRIEQDYGCLNIIDIYNDGVSVIKLLNGSCDGRL